jgi:hypothetical protein
MEEDERPDLEKCLEYYEVDFSPNRPVQMARCPFHEDRTPSLSLNLNKGVWRCHSCSKGGDAYTLIEEKEGVDFVGARGFASAQHLTDGGSGGGDGEVSGELFGGRRRAAGGAKGNNRKHGGYVPAWRRN